MVSKEYSEIIQFFSSLSVSWWLIVSMEAPLTQSIMGTQASILIYLRKRLVSEGASIGQLSVVSSKTTSIVK